MSNDILTPFMCLFLFYFYVYLRAFIIWPWLGSVGVFLLWHTQLDLSASYKNHVNIKVMEEHHGGHTDSFTYILDFSPSYVSWYTWYYLLTLLCLSTLLSTAFSWYILFWSFGLEALDNGWSTSSAQRKRCWWILIGLCTRLSKLFLADLLFLYI